MRSTRLIPFVASAVVLAGSVLLSAPPGVGAPANGPVITTRVVQGGQVTRLADSSGPETAPAVGPEAGQSQGPVANRSLSSKARATRNPNTLSGIPAPSTAVVGATGARSFSGIDHHEQRLEVAGGNQWSLEPPDQGLCVGNGFILEAVNSAYSIYRTNGQRVRGPFNVNDLFNEGSTEFTSDPRCYFEPATHTWYAVILFIDFATGASRVDLAVNTSGDPTNVWTQYRIDTTDDGRLGEPSHPGCPCLGDQPLFGIDHHNVYLSTNEFSVFGTEFNGAQIYAVAKSDLLAGRPNAHFVHFDDLQVGGALAASVQPATTSQAASAEYFLSSLDPNGTFDSRLGVWAMTGRARVATGGVPTLSSMVVSSQPYGVPPPAAQKGSGSTIDSGDDRMQQAQFTGGRLWGALTTAVTIPGDRAERAGAAWFSVVPTVRHGVVSAARIDRQGYVVRPGAFVIYPAIQANARGRAAMTFTLTGSKVFPSAAYATLGAGAKNFRAPAVAAAGTGPYDANATRWGDYSYASISPSGTKVWLATEYVPPRSSQTPDGRRNWGTRVFSVTLS